MVHGPTGLHGRLVLQRVALATKFDAVFVTTHHHPEEEACALACLLRDDSAI